MSGVWNNTFWLYCCEFLWTTEAQSWEGRLQVDHVPCWYLSPLTVFLRGVGALILGWASGTDRVYLPSVPPGHAGSGLLPLDSISEFKWKLPCHLSITLFQPSHPQFLLLFHLWLISTICLLFLGWSWILRVFERSINYCQWHYWASVLSESSPSSLGDSSRC